MRNPAFIVLAVLGAVLLMGVSYYAGTRTGVQKIDVTPPPQVGVLPPPQNQNSAVPSSTAPAVPQCTGNTAAFLPRGTSLVKELAIDFEKDGVNEDALAYRIVNDPETRSADDTGIVILKCVADSWVQAFNLSSTGAQMISIAPLAADKVNGLYAQFDESGAGTVMDWAVIVPVNGKFVQLDRVNAMNAVLVPRGYNFLGYNGGGIQNGLVVETIPGYSRTASRAAPDLPSLRLTYRFTGTDIQVVKVETLPFAPSD